MSRVVKQSRGKPEHVPRGIWRTENGGRTAPTGQKKDPLLSAFCFLFSPARSPLPGLAARESNRGDLENGGRRTENGERTAPTVQKKGPTAFCFLFSVFLSPLPSRKERKEGSPRNVFGIPLEGTSNLTFSL